MKEWRSNARRPDEIKAMEENANRAPAMPSEGERLRAWQRFTVLMMKGGVDLVWRNEARIAGYDALNTLLAEERAAARLEALTQAADRLAELEPCRCNLAWADRGLHDSDCRHDLHEEIRHLSAPPQKTQEET